MTEENIKVANIKLCETKFGQRVLIETEDGGTIWITPKNALEWMNKKTIVMSTNPPKDPSHNAYKRIEGVQ